MIGRIALLLVLLVTAASAQEKTGLDFTQLLFGLDGNALFQPGDDCVSQANAVTLVPGKTCSKSELTLSDVTVVALETTLEGDRNEDPKKRFERDVLARKIYKKDNANLTTEEITLIKDRIGRVYNAAVVGAAWPLLDPSLKGK